MCCARNTQLNSLQFPSNKKNTTHTAETLFIAFVNACNAMCFFVCCAHSNRYCRKWSGLISNSVFHQLVNAIRSYAANVYIRWRHIGGPLSFLCTISAVVLRAPDISLVKTRSRCEWPINYTFLRTICCSLRIFLNWNHFCDIPRWIYLYYSIIDGGDFMRLLGMSTHCGDINKLVQHVNSDTARCVMHSPRWAQGIPMDCQLCCPIQIALCCRLVRCFVVRFVCARFYCFIVCRLI